MEGINEMTQKEKHFKLFLKCVDLFQDDSRYHNEAYNLSRAQARWTNDEGVWYVLKMLVDPYTKEFGVYLAVGKQQNVFLSKRVNTKNECRVWLERFELTYNAIAFPRES